MSTTANRTRGAVPTRMAAALAALSLLAMPVPAGAQGSGRTVLLTLTEGASLTQLADTVGALGGRVLATLELSDSLLVELPKGVGAPAGSAEIPDTPMKVNSASTTQYHAVDKPSYRQTIDAPDGADVGKGVKVALVDTGVERVDGLTHVIPVKVKGVATKKNGLRDGLGHGTFLAGIIGGTGSNNGFQGVAPGASLYDVKVADEEGNTSLSTVLAGLEAANKLDVDVVNLSLSSGSPLPPSFDPLTLALDRLWADGVTVVTAAGNGGPRSGSVTSPGNDPLLLTVGALDEDADGERGDDAVADFSSRGTKYSVAKPDLVAPGVSLVSTAAPNSIAVRDNPDSVLADPRYMRGSGTSMSAAVVTGAVAAVLAAKPALAPNGVKELLTSSTYKLADSDGAGKGALDLAKALKLAAGAPLNPRQGFTVPDLGEWGPVEADAEAWEDFADAWESGDFDAVQEAWTLLSPQTQLWGARIFAMAVVYGSLDSADLEARGWAARGWAARGWASDKWLARGWAARGWAARGWAARGWAARGWALDDWAARGWAARGWAARGWASEDWEARGWAARGWAEFIWDARGWAARGWAMDVWAARGWARTPRSNGSE